MNFFRSVITLIVGLVVAIPMLLLILAFLYVLLKVVF